MNNCFVFRDNVNKNMIPYEQIVPCPNEQLSILEMEDNINKFGSLMSLLTNKPISCVTLFSLLQKDEELKQILTSITDCNFYENVRYMAHRWLVLNKSKKIM